MTTQQATLPTTIQNSAAYYARRRSRNRLLHASLVYGILAIISVIFVLPLTWMILTSVKSAQEAFYFPPTIIPRAAGSQYGAPSPTSAGTK